MYERDILESRPAITGRFRNWLYVAARRHAVDEWRKMPSPPRAIRPRSSDLEPVDPSSAGSRRFAVRCRRVLCAQRPAHDGRSGAQAPARGRKVRALDDLRGAGAGPAHPGPRRRRRATSCWRCSPARRPASSTTGSPPSSGSSGAFFPRLIPADPTENLTPEERFQELLEILRASKNNRLWLAFLTNPLPGPERLDGFVARAGGTVGRARSRPKRCSLPRSFSDELPGPAGVLAGDAAARLSRRPRRSRTNGCPRSQRRRPTRPARPLPRPGARSHFEWNDRRVRSHRRHNARPPS